MATSLLRHCLNHFTVASSTSSNSAPVFRLRELSPLLKCSKILFLFAKIVDNLLAGIPILE
ncbi:hypothetical protein PGB90_000366 [Kerria lacca]